MGTRGLSTALVAGLLLIGPRWSGDIACAADGTWVKLQPVPKTKVLPRFFTNCTPTGTISSPIARAYAGVVMGNGRLFYFGGGHVGHPGNDVETYDIATNAWTQEYAPECVPACCCSPTCNPTNACANQPPGDPNGILGPCRILGGNGTKLLTPLGRPYTEHTFRLSTYNTARGKFFAALTSGNWEYDSGSATWTQLSTARPNSNDIATKHVTYDPSVGVLYFATAPTSGPPSVYRFDYTTNTWVLHGRMPDLVATQWREFYSAYDSEHGQHLVEWHGDSGHMWLYRASAGVEPTAGSWVEISMPDAVRCRGEISDACPASFAYDRNNHAFVVGKRRPSDNTFQIFAYKPDTNTWTQPVLNGGLPTSPLAGFWGTMGYDPTTSKLYFVNTRATGASGTGGTQNGDAETWSLSLTSLGRAVVAGGTPLPAPTTPPTAAAGSTAVPPGGSSPTPVATGRTSTPGLTTTQAVTATPTAGIPGVVTVPLTIQELLPADDAGGPTPHDVVGYQRVGEPATFGVPLYDGNNISSIAQLAVRSAATGQLVPAQFRVLKRYPSGNIQWVLIDVQADVAAGKINTDLSLVTGSNPASGAIATDGAMITVTTGAATFTIRKASQNVIDTATIGGTTLLSMGHAGSVIFQDATGTTFRSDADATSTATIEENGPLRAVVLERGRLKDSGGQTSLGYSLRLTFYKDKTFVKAQLSLENGFRDSLTRKGIGYAELRLPLTLGATKSFTFATKTGATSAVLGTSAYLFQGATAHKATSTAIKQTGSRSPFTEENDWSFHGNAITGTGQDGFTIVHDGSTLQPFTTTADYSRGFADLSDSGNVGLAIAMRDFDSSYPSGIEVNNSGDVAIEVYSKHNVVPSPTPGTLLFGFGGHDTRDVILDFHTTAPDLTLTHYRAQYPLFGRAPYAQYAGTGAFLGRTQLVTQAELAAYHTANTIGGVNVFAAGNGSWGYTTYTLPNQQIVRMRSYSWSDGGRQTNNDLLSPKLLQYLSTGYGGQFQTAYNLAHFISDQAVHHSDRADATTWPWNPWSTVPTGTGYAVIATWSNQFEDDLEHQNVIGWPLFYYLTGDENVREALVDHGEFLLNTAPWSASCRFTGPADRTHSQRAKWFSILWEFTGDSRFKTQVDGMTDGYLCSMKDLENATTVNTGQDPTRGYWWNSLAPPRLMSIGPLDYIRSEGMYELMRVLPDSDPRKEELGDRLLGAAYFAAREPYFDNANRPCHGFSSPGVPGLYQLDSAPVDSSRSEYDLWDYMFLLGYGYQRTKDPVFLNVGRRVVSALGAYDTPICGTANTVSQGYAVYSSWAAQGFTWLDMHQSEFGVVFLNDDPASYGGLRVTNNGNGSYTLQWTVPTGALRYQIKLGPQPMVPNLNFDKVARSYQYDPALYDNFWAGNGDQSTAQPRNVAVEPTPAPPDTQQTFTISGLSPTAVYHFAIRIDTSAGAPPSSTNRPSAPRLQ